MSARDPYEQQERIAEARALVNSPVLKEVFDTLREEYVERLVQEEVGTLTATTLHASMKVLADVQGRLRSISNDGLFTKRNRK